MMPNRRVQSLVLSVIVFVAACAASCSSESSNPGVATSGAGGTEIGGGGAVADGGEAVAGGGGAVAGGGGTVAGGGGAVAGGGGAAAGGGGTVAGGGGTVAGGGGTVAVDGGPGGVGGALTGWPLGVDSGVPAGSKGAASLVYDRAIPTISFAAADIRVALTMSGYTVTEVPLANLASVTAPVRVVVTTTDSAPGKAFLGSATPPALTAQGFALREDPAAGTTAWWVLGADNIGAMYGGLEVAETTRLALGLTTLKPLEQNPYIANRGVKCNIPLDARTPSYTDNATAAQMNIAEVWDIGFWHDYFDTMARYRLNHINIWNLHPFPSMVKVPEYPNVALADVKKTSVQLHPALNGPDMSTPTSLAALTTLKTMTIDQKIAFWKEVMQYAADRGIDVYLFTWNIYLYGTESSGYSIVNDVNNATTTDYFRKSVYQLVRTYPLLRGIGFAVAENMMPSGLSSALKEAWAVKTYVAGINDAIAAEPGRKFDVIHRTQQTDLPSIGAAMTPSLNVPWNFEYKYPEAHTFVTTKPEKIYPDLPNISTTHKVWLNCRDDSYFLLRWGDPEFVRGLIKNMDVAPMSLSKVAGIFLGANIALGRETASVNPASPRQLFIQKRWMSYMPFGRLGYDPAIPAQRFVDLIHDRFPEVSAQTLYDAWTKASQIIPQVHQLIWVGAPGSIYGTQDDWEFWPEACLWNPAGANSGPNNSAFFAVQQFMTKAPMPSSGMNGIGTFAKGTGTGTSPLAVADSVQALADQVLLLTPTLSAAKDRELKETIGDIESLALLGRYYAWKIRAAVNLSYATPKKPEAILNLQEASKAWRAYAARVATLYTPQVMARMVGPGATPATDMTQLQAFVDKEITDLGGTVPP